MERMFTDDELKDELTKTGLEQILEAVKIRGRPKRRRK